METGRSRRIFGLLGAIAVAVFTCAAQTAGADGRAVQTDGARGPVTNLPLPRYVSMKAEKGNVRRGPSLTNRVDWVFLHKNMPLLVTAEYGHWRRVIDRDGAVGWMHYALLSGVRTVIIETDMVALLSQPDPNSLPVALAELGVIARLGVCRSNWCRINAGRQWGWVRKSDLWGVGPTAPPD